MPFRRDKLERLERDFDLSSYTPVSVEGLLRNVILSRLRKGEEILPDIDGREDTKGDLLRAILSGSHPYLVSEEGTGKTRLTRALARLLPPVPAIRGCPYHDDPKWEGQRLCNACQEAGNPVEKFGIEFIPGAKRFSRVQGNEYTNEAKLLGLKDIQAIAHGVSPSDPGAFIGTGIFRANRGILMIDELPAIRTKVQVLLHPLLEEKKAILEEYHWERFVDLLVIATGNPYGFSHVNEMPRPLLDRIELIYMDLPEEDVEKEIILKERFARRERELHRVHDDSDLVHDPSVDLELLEPKVIVPWWVLDALNLTIRYSRECPNLDKKPSIRAGTRAFDHTLSNVELQGREIATLKDAFLGLRLALRGRISLLPEYIDFDNPERTIKRTDQVVEDMLRDVLKGISNRIFKAFEFDGDNLQKELIAVHDNAFSADHALELTQFPELQKAIGWMTKSWQSKLPAHCCTGREKDVFELNDTVGEALRHKYLESAVGFLTACAAVAGVVPEPAVAGTSFVPKTMT